MENENDERSDDSTYSSDDQPRTEDQVSESGGTSSNNQRSMVRRGAGDSERHDGVQEGELLEGADVNTSALARVEQLIVSKSGPLPAVEDFDGYERILPGAADRILSMAESSVEMKSLAVKADAEVQRSVAESICRSSRVGSRQQWIFAALAAGTIVAAVVLAWGGKEVPSLLAFVIAIASGVASYKTSANKPDFIPPVEDGQ